MNVLSDTLLRRRLGIAGLAVLATAGALYTAGSFGQFSLDQQPIAWHAPLDFSSYDLSSGSAVGYRGDYIASTFDGDLVAYDVSSAGAFTTKWKASATIAAYTARKIFTSSASGTGVAFQWSGTSAITSAQQALLGDSSTGPKVLNYLRGDTSNEITTANPYPTGLFRPRLTKLGAVIHSRPYYDNGTVYVGANDGMVHAFDAATGAERFAYVPSMLFAGGRLSSVSTPYSTTFPYTVDASLAIGSIGGTGSTKLLVGGLGGGAKGVWAIDITSPSPASESAAAAMAKWEITEASTGYANLGNVMTAPQFVKLNSGETAVLVPNGLNSAGKGSSLFLIRASDGSKLAEISAGTVLADGTANALGGLAAIDTDGNGTVDVVYAGDLKGTLWKFDLGSSSYPSAGSAVFTPDFAEARPITAAPSVMRHPKGGLHINFGTGRVYTSGDLTSTSAEYLYGVWDSGSVATSNLVTQTLANRTVPSTTTVVRTSSSSTVSYSSSVKGWKIALSGGERLVGGDLLTDSGRFTVTTTIPNSGSTQGAWLMQVDGLTGGAPSSPFFDLNGDGLIKTADNTDRIAVSTGGTTSVLVPVGKFLGTGTWSQPVLGQVSSTLDLPLFNYNPNTALAAYTSVITTTPAPVGESGVYGGHFDFDIFYACGSASIDKSSCTGHQHVHQYDDKWNVVGVNMLNASTPAFNLSNAIPSTSTPSFKILVANTLWSPAATLIVGNNISGVARNLPLSPEGFLAETAGGPAKVFTRATLSTFTYVLPLNAFTNKDWGTGQVRSGLIPSVTGCVGANANPDTAWMDGAFTVQVVDASATGSDVKANTPSDAGGYRLKDSTSGRRLLLAQYTAFWHHPNGKCKTAVGWTMAPPPASSGANQSTTRPAGTADPTGDFESGVAGGIAGGSGSTTVKSYLGITEVTVTRTIDASGVRQLLTNTSGTVVSDTRSNFGTPQKSDLQQGQRARLGRLGWKEIVR